MFADDCGNVKLLLLFFLNFLFQTSERNLLSEEVFDVLLAMVQVAAAVQGGVRHQQEPPLHL